jgi:phosphoribosylformylglycinamidine (FGAM) synthase-like amidotransferase family enzyme
MADAPKTDGAYQEQTAQMDVNGVPLSGGKVKTQKERTILFLPHPDMFSRERSKESSKDGKV